MSPRTKPIDEAITRDHSSEGGGRRYIEYQPGDGTLYALLFTRLDFARVKTDTSTRAWMVTLTNFPHSPSVAITPGCFIAPGYVEEKLSLPYASAFVVAEIIARLCGCTAYLSEDYHTLSGDC